MDFVQIAGSLIAILLLGLMARWLFPKPEKLTEERVVRNVARFCPDIPFDSTQAKLILGDKGKSAVLAFPRQADGLALVTAFGDRVVVRHIPNLAELDVQETGTGIKIATHDFTQPSIKLALGDEAKQAALDLFNRYSNRESAHA